MKDQGIKEKYPVSVISYFDAGQVCPSLHECLGMRRAMLYIDYMTDPASAAIQLWLTLFSNNLIKQKRRKTSYAGIVNH